MARPRSPRPTTDARSCDRVVVYQGGSFPLLAASGEVSIRVAGRSLPLLGTIRVVEQISPYPADDDRPTLPHARVTIGPVYQGPLLREHRDRTLELDVVRAPNGRLVAAYDLEIDARRERPYLAGCRQRGKARDDRRAARAALVQAAVDRAWAERDRLREALERARVSGSRAEHAEAARAWAEHDRAWGERAQAAPRQHQTGSDEVRPQGDDPSDASPYHGGDGCSREVDAPSSAPSHDAEGHGSSESQGPDPERGTGHEGRPSSGAQPCGPCAELDPGDGGGDRGSSAPPRQERDSSARLSLACSDAREVGGSLVGDDPAPGAPAAPLSPENRRAGEIRHPEHPPADGASRRTGRRSGESVSDEPARPDSDERHNPAPSAEGVTGESPDLGPSAGPSTYGGDSLAIDLSPPSGEDTRASREIARLLSRLVGTVGVHGEPSPRISPARLVRELVSRRVSLSRARRDEIEPPVVLISVDVSGSCSACCSDAWRAAQLVADRDPCVVLATHSNGVHVGRVRTASPVLRARLSGRPPYSLADLVGRLSAECRLMVNLGDLDAAAQARHIQTAHPACRVIWLDSYAKSAGPRPASARWWASARDLDPHRLTAWQGIGDAASASIALRHILSGR